MQGVRVPLRQYRAVLVVLSVLAVACSGDTPTTPTTTEETTYTDVFIGAVSVGETRFHSFVVTNAGNAALTLASLTIGAQVVTSPVTLAIGTPAEGACSVSTSVSTRPALTSNLSYAVSAGTYCVSIADANSSLSGSAQYSIRVVRP